MKVGLGLWPNRDVASLCDLAVAAEQAGFAEVWWPDHYDAREFSAVLAVCAVRTSTIKLGTAVTSPLLRHPAILASLFATIDELSHGRAIAGLGPGGFEVKGDLGISPKSPLGATRESVELLRGLLDGGTVTQEADSFFGVKSAKLTFTPPGNVPIYLAARGPKMIELAGEMADGLITHGLAPGYLQFTADRVRAGADRAGRAAKACDIALMLDVVVADGVAAARDILRPRCLLMAGGAYSEDLIPRYGLDPEAVGKLKAAVSARDPHAVDFVTDEMVDAFTVGGPPEVVADRLASFVDSGVNSVILSLGADVDAETITKVGKAIAKVAS